MNLDQIMRVAVLLRPYASSGLQRKMLPRIAALFILSITTSMLLAGIGLSGLYLLWSYLVSLGWEIPSIFLVVALSALVLILALLRVMLCLANGIKPKSDIGEIVEAFLKGLQTPS